MDWDMILLYVAKGVQNGGHIDEVWKNARELFGIKDKIPISQVQAGLRDIAGRTAAQARTAAAELNQAVRLGRSAQEIDRLRSVANAATQNARYLEQASSRANPGFLRSLGRWVRHPFGGGGAGSVGGAGMFTYTGVGTLGTVSLGTVATLAGIGAAALLIGGLIYVNSGDGPVQPGPQLSRSRTPDPSRVGSEVTYNQDPYSVFVLDISGGSVYIGQESVVKNTPGCKFAGGGLCRGNDPPVPYQVKAGPFKTYDAARAAWCNELRGKPLMRWAVANDSKAPVYGGNYWIGTAPSCS
jgi:hypothetical protein